MTHEPQDIDPASRDPKALWQGQDMQGGIRVDDIHALMRAWRARLFRLRAALVAVALVGVAAGAPALLSPTATPLMRLSGVLFVAGFLVFGVRGWLRFRPADPGADARACLDALRARLLMRRREVHGGWMVTGAPILPGFVVGLVAIVAADPRMAVVRLAPIGAAFVVWTAVFVVRLRRQSAAIDRELAALDAMERG